MKVLYDPMYDIGNDVKPLKTEAKFVQPMTNVSQYGANGVDVAELETSKGYAEDAKKWAEASEKSAQRSESAAATVREGVSQTLEYRDETRALKDETETLRDETQKIHDDTTSKVADLDEKLAEAAASAQDAAVSAGEAGLSAEQAAASAAAADASAIGAEAAKDRSEEIYGIVVTSRDQAVSAANAAQASEANAKISEVNAKASEVAAAHSAEIAQSSQEIAQGYVDKAKEQADRAESEADSSAASAALSTTEAGKAAASASQAVVAKEEAVNAQALSEQARDEARTAAGASSTSASESAASAATALAQAKLAKSSADASAASATASAGSASDSASSADASSNKAEESAESASAALASQNAAKASETKAKASETSAASSAAASEDSATNSQSSASQASSSASSSASSATESAASASAASSSAGAAASSANAASNSASESAASASASLGSSNDSQGFANDSEASATASASSASTATNEASKAATSATNAGLSASSASDSAALAGAKALEATSEADRSTAEAVKSKESADKSQEIYEAFQKGSVYRGVWNPMETPSYPDALGVNSQWDVVLNSGVAEYEWNGIKWHSGDRLIYTESDKAYYHVSRSVGVNSINGKTGDVNLVARDVGALPEGGDGTKVVRVKDLTIDSANAMGIRHYYPSTSGGWARGHSFYSPANDALKGTFGAYGGGDALTRLVMSVGGQNDWYTGNYGLSVTANHIQWKGKNILTTDDSYFKANVYNKTESDAKYYLKTGGAVGWVHVNVDGADRDMIKIGSARPWSFRMKGAQGESGIQLFSHVSDKSFSVGVTEGLSLSVAVSRDVDNRNVTMTNPRSSVDQETLPNSLVRKDYLDTEVGKLLTPSEGDSKYYLKGSPVDSVKNKSTSTTSGDWDTFSPENFELFTSSVNSPSGNASNGFFIPHQGSFGNSYGTQFAGRASSFFFRSKENNSWQPWRKIYHDGNKPTATDVGAMTAGSAYTKAESDSRFLFTSGVSATDVDNRKQRAVRYDPSTRNPTNEHYSGITYGNGGNVTGQLLTHFVSGKSFIRAFNSAWSPWAQIYTSVHKPSASDVGAMGAGTAYTKSEADARYLKLIGGTLTGKLNTTGYSINGTNFVGQSSSVIRVGDSEFVRNLNLNAASGNIYAQYKEGETAVLKRIYHQGFKPTAADVGAISLDTGDTRWVKKSGDTMTSALRITGTSAGNVAPSTDQLKLDGYGLIGNRGSVYLQNANASGAVVIGVGGIFNSNVRIRAEAGSVTTYVPLLVSTTTARTLVVGSTGTIPNASIADQNRFLEISAPATSSHNQKTGVVFHHNGTSTSALQYENENSNIGRFVFKSDDSSYQGVRVENAGILPIVSSLPSNAADTKLGFTIGSTGASAVGDYGAYCTIMTANVGSTSRNFQIMVDNGGTAIKIRAAHTNAAAATDWHPWRTLYHDGKKPTPAEIGALTKSQADGYYLGKTAKPSTSGTADYVVTRTSTSTSYFPVLWASGNGIYKTHSDRVKIRGSDGHIQIYHGYLGHSGLGFNNEGYVYPIGTDHRDAGMYGNYDSNRTAHIWSMGISYKIPANGSNFGNLYGFAYKHTNNTTGGTMGGGHQAVWCTNGTPRASIGESGIWSIGNYKGRIRGHTEALSTLTSGDAPALSIDMYTAPAQVSGKTRYVPLIKGACSVSGYGYQNHLSIGWKRPYGGGWGSVYLATAGNDSYPTKEYLFGVNNDGSFRVPGSVYTAGGVYSSGDVRGTSNGKFFSMQCRNTSYCHMETDASSGFYSYDAFNFAQGLYVLKDKWIYLNTKGAFRAVDTSWLRINDTGGFTSGIFCGNSLLRTDGSITCGSWGSTNQTVRLENGFYDSTWGNNGTAAVSINKADSSGAQWAFASYYDSSNIRAGIQILTSSTGTIRLYTNRRSRYVQFEGGSITAQYNITAYSDARVKTDIEVIPNALDKVQQLRGITYTRTDDDSGVRKVGLIAQEVEKVLPEAVLTSEREDLEIEDFKSVDYGNIVGLLVEAIKELKAEVNSLKEELNGFKS